MKSYFMGIIVFVMFLFVSLPIDVQMNDIKEIRRELKMAGEFASASGVNFINDNYLSDGYIVFNEIEAMKAIKYSLKATLNLNNDFTHKGKNSIKLQSALNYKVYFFNENNKLSIYEDGSFISSETISYPYTFNDTKSTFNEIIYEPAIVITLNAGTYNSYNNTSFFKRDIIVRNTNYTFSNKY